MLYLPLFKLPVILWGGSRLNEAGLLKAGWMYSRLEKCGSGGDKKVPGAWSGKEDPELPRRLLPIVI